MLETVARHGNSPPLLHVGDVRRFGPDGILYVILALPKEGGKALIRVLETDEELTYPIGKILADPTD